MIKGARSFKKVAGMRPKSPLVSDIVAAAVQKESSASKVASFRAAVSEGIEDDDPAHFRYPHRFNPLAPLKKTWDLVLMFVILYSVIIVPYRISFDVEVRDRERPPPRPPRRETQPVPRTPSS